MSPEKRIIILALIATVSAGAVRLAWVTSPRSSPGVGGTSSSAVTFIEGETGSLRTNIDGVTVGADDDVYVVSMTFHPPGARPIEIFEADGHPVGVRNGVLFVGGSRFGAVRAGADVHLTKIDVLVDGKSRGAMPPPGRIRDAEAVFRALDSAGRPSR